MLPSPQKPLCDPCAAHAGGDISTQPLPRHHLGPCFWIKQHTPWGVKLACPPISSFHYLKVKNKENLPKNILSLSFSQSSCFPYNVLRVSDFKWKDQTINNYTSVTGVGTACGFLNLNLSPCPFSYLSESFQISSGFSALWWSILTSAYPYLESF